MPEIKQSMLPDPDSQKDEPVKEEPIVSEDVKTPEAPAPQQEETPAPPPVQEPKGAKTPEPHAQAAFLEERAKRKEAEQRIKELEQQLQETENSPAPSNEVSDEELSYEGRALKQEITANKRELAEIKETFRLNELQAVHPVLKDKADEFEEFRQEKSYLTLDDAVELFTARHAVSSLPARKGLERPTAGDKTPPQQGLSDEDWERLRTNQPRQWLKKIQQEKDTDKLFR